jgi:hypothetical protein
MTQIQHKGTGSSCPAITLLSLLLLTGQLSAKPLKVFILAGQSNMEGPAQVATFDYLGDDPATAPLLEQMRGEDGQPRVCDHVWISYLTGANEENFELTGKLTAGNGSMWGLDPTKPGDKIGPELLAHFIRDVRQDLGAPKLPFVIGVLGVGGVEASPDVLAFREAMTAPARLPEFIGNVTAVPTAPFWSEELGAIAAKHEQIRDLAYRLERKDRNSPNRDGTMTDAQQREYLEQFEADLISSEEAALWKRGASNAGYHYLGCAKTAGLPASVPNPT